MKQLLLSLVLVFGLSATPALATSSPTTTQAETTTTVETVVDVPSPIGMFFRSIGERFRLLVTTDDAKKTELRLRFAEERETIAAALLAEEEIDVRVRERAERIAERASVFANRASQQLDHVVQQDPGRAEALMRRLAAYQERFEMRVTRMEGTIENDGETDESTMTAVREQLAETVSTSERLLRAIANEHISEDVRQRLEANRERIEAHLQAVRDMQVERSAVQEANTPGTPEFQEAMERVRRSFEERMNERNQSNTSSDASDPDDDGDGVGDASAMPAQNHNSSRSNRTDGVASPDYFDPDDDGDGIPDEESAAANVCDGVTCADGSCTATADECSSVDTSVQTRFDGNPLYQADTQTRSSAMYEGE